MTNYEGFYSGSATSLDSDYENIFTGYRVPAGEIGATTSIQTANQVKEVTNLLNQGIKHTEVSLIDKNVFDMIPKQGMEDIARLQKLTGSEVSLHSPIIEPSGFTQQGWSEENRELHEHQLWDVVRRGQKLDTKGNMPIVIHSSGIQGSTEMIEDGKRVQDMIIAVDKESGEMRAVKRDKRYYPGAGDEIVEMSAKQELASQNVSY